MDPKNARHSTVEISLDWETHSQKPSVAFARTVSTRIASQPISITVEDFAKAVASGRTWAQGIYRDGKRRNDCFLYQQVVGIDIDAEITIEQAIARCEEYDVRPAFAYATFSHEPEHHKFRIVFVLESPVFDVRVRETIQLLFLALFPEADKACRDAARVYYGGKQIVHADYDQTVDVIKLVDAVSTRMLETRGDKKIKRDMTRLSTDLGVHTANGFPDIVELSANDYMAAGTTLAEWHHVSDDDIVVTVIGSKAYGFRYAHTFTKEHVVSGKKHKSDIQNRIATSSIPLVTKVDWTRLAENSGLFRQFITGVTRYSESILYGLLTNLLHLEGGRLKFFEGMNKRSDYDIARWEAKATYAKRRNYLPMRYANFFPQAHIDEASPSLYQTARLRASEVVKIHDLPMQTTDEANAKLREALDECLAADDTRVKLIITPTGVGKTEACLSLQNVLVAVPTHALKVEFAERAHYSYTEYECEKTDDIVKHLRQMVESGDIPNPLFPSSLREVTISPMLCKNIDSTVLDRIDELYSMDATKKVQQYLHRVRASNPDIDTYLNEMQAFYSSDGTSVTTHDRLIWMTGDKRTRIIDEDIMATLLPTGEIDMADLIVANRAIQQSTTVPDADKRVIDDLIEDVLNGNSFFHKMPTFYLKDLDSVESVILRAVSPSLGGSVVAFLHCDHYVKDAESDLLRYVTRHTLPEDRKHVILSATASVAIYKQFFGDRLDVYEIGHVQNVGAIEQYPQRSYSRSSIKNAPELLDIARYVAQNQFVITFKGLRSEFAESQVGAHYGALAGLDHLKGEDIVVVGTPHVPPYAHLLVAIGLGFEPTLKDVASYNKYQVIRNGFRFWMKTYAENTILREIQLSLIESALTQAIGRARLSRMKATVTVLSNYPIVGAEIKTVDAWNELRASALRWAEANAVADDGLVFTEDESNGICRYNGA